MAQDYTNTLNLPTTDFSMRANLPTKEPQIYENWEKTDLYGKIQKKNEGKPTFILHDGPPYANGNIHLGHSLNKILKDFIFRYKNMSGYRTPYIHGWDTHGLPIEKQMVKKHKINRSEISTVEFRKLCAEFARENVKNQMEQMKRLGVMGDWDNSYLTILPKFEAEQIRIFGKMAKNGYIYKGMKPVYWCPVDETALAEAEIEYRDIPCDSIYVKFKVTDDKGMFSSHTGSLDNVYFVIWTTTTWTLPGNLAVCLGPEIEYSLCQCGSEYYIMATELAGSVLSDYKVVAKFQGSDMEGMVAEHPFFPRASHIIVGDHVTLDSGTGCVHTAPGFGAEDFEVCKKYDFIETIVPVDSKGRLNELAGKYNGLTTEEANKAILEDIRESGALLATKKIEHQYPHCWRCKNPIIFRATEQWFCSVDGFKKQALEAIKDVKWIPAWGENRITSMVSDRSDWCISRQRTWGVPIPIVYCEDCGEPLITEETIEKIASLFEKEGSDAWYKYSAEEILGSQTCAKCGSTHFHKEKDIMDVWFDSGSSYAYVLDNMPGHQFPCDLYLEGNDQYRGWFQSSLLTSVATRGCAPYKSVITHGMIIDMEGRKMSKSLGNGIDPMQVINTFGADILRLWVSSVDYTNDARISNDILKQLSEIYRKIRNTARIILANLGSPETDFNPNRDMVPPSEMYDIDRWALARLNRLIQNVENYYNRYEFHFIYHDINNFCTIDMSKLYIDIIKDRVYVERKDSQARRSAQSALYHILNALVRMLAPILAFTSEEIWHSMAHLDNEDPESILLNSMPVYNKEWEFNEEERYNKLFELRDDVLKALETARSEKLIGKSLDAKVIITAHSKEIFDLLKSFEKDLATVYIVSQVELLESPDAEKTLSVEVKPADGCKCGRCWVYAKEGKTIDEGFVCQRCLSILEK